VHDSNQADKR